MASSDDIEATRQALERLARDGSDLSKALEMDFFVAVPDAAAGKIVASRVKPLGLRACVEQDTETGEWTCYCTGVLVPRLADVVSIERRLDELAADVGGHSDGFGSFGNASS